MKKFLFFVFISWNCLLGQLTSRSIEPPFQQLQSVAYRHVGDSIERFVELRISSGSLDTVIINTTIEPELLFRGLFTPGQNPIPTFYTAQGNGYQIIITGNQLDSLAVPIQGSTVNYNHRLDSNEVLTFRERSRVISCSVGDQNNASNQSLYTLSGSISGNTQANTIIV